MSATSCDRSEIVNVIEVQKKKQRVNDGYIDIDNAEGEDYYDDEDDEYDDEYDSEIDLELQTGLSG